MTLYQKEVIFTDADAQFQVLPDKTVQNLPGYWLTNSGTVGIEHRSANPVTLNVWSPPPATVQEFYRGETAGMGSPGTRIWYDDTGRFSNAGLVWEARGKVTVPDPLHPGSYTEENGVLTRLYDGTAVQTIEQRVVGSSSDPQIADDGTVYFAGHALTWYSESVDQHVTGGYPKTLIVWDVQEKEESWVQPIITQLKINARSKKIGYVLWWREYLSQSSTLIREWLELHLLSPDGHDEIIGEPVVTFDGQDTNISWHRFAINETGCLAWSVTHLTPDQKHGCVHLYLYDGTDTTEIGQTGDWNVRISLNSRNQVLYETGFCDESQLYLYDHAQGTTTNVTNDLVASGMKYNEAAEMNKTGRMVWHAFANYGVLFSTHDLYTSPATTVIYTSRNGDVPQSLGPGYEPTINDQGQILYWDHNARELVLLTPTTPENLRRAGYDVRNLVPFPPDINVVFDRGVAYVNGTDPIDLSKPFSAAVQTELPPPI